MAADEQGSMSVVVPACALPAGVRDIGSEEQMVTDGVNTSKDCVKDCVEDCVKGCFKECVKDGIKHCVKDGVKHWVKHCVKDLVDTLIWHAYLTVCITHARCKLVANSPAYNSVVCRPAKKIACQAWAAKRERTKASNTSLNCLLAGPPDETKS